MDQGIFPDIFKSAKITPVFKKGVRNMIKNYRPISILCNIAKIFEAVICSRLKEFFMSQNLLSEKQFGFRTNKSTEMAVHDLIFKLLPAFENKKYAICVFLDYSACFDTISREILLDKMKRYGVRGTELELIKSYLKGRQQYVNYSNTNSTHHQQNI